MIDLAGVRGADYPVVRAADSLEAQPPVPQKIAKTTGGHLSPTRTRVDVNATSNPPGERSSDGAVEPPFVDADGTRRASCEVNACLLSAGGVPWGAVGGSDFDAMSNDARRRSWAKAYGLSPTRSDDAASGGNDDAVAEPPARGSSGDRSHEQAASQATLARNITSAEIPPRARAALQEFAKHLAQVRLPPLSRFVLFGSYARGDFREDSDLDVAVVFEGAPPPPGAQLTRINELLVDPADAVLEAELMPLSPIAVWETELGDGTSLPEWPFYRNVVREGIDLGALRPGSEGRVHPR